MRRPALPLLAATAAAVVVAGCGSAGSPAASRPEPPGPVTLSAFVSRSAVRLSPARVGAGPVLFTVVNQSPASASVVLSGGGGAVARTAPINPGGVTQVKIDLARGTYTVSALAAPRHTDAQRARSQARAVTTTLRVGAERASGGDQTLQP